ncbi:DNA starvation/stationary phase protection protein Dps [Candidatus Pantoea edessiphila]|uniref:DNA starvation/stationary phase protection protein Dps n=1 Tax=Candidatus Pantoea edessiphila TaxID=2044610 RepID=A0A2P5SYX4_9GAMM|nr:DNA starvation/stationary phase protection protein Dps [Candidatus Pantoea edessiphila]MBK4775323.1 DNA starvation/stationary phase protection protein Dps [Pantoea sp. Edef]PPI87541.1 DNA starvation/stationary phase protection protein Dps [Candidatus Pantoea edessiphila]
MKNIKHTDHDCLSSDLIYTCSHIDTNEKIHIINKLNLLLAELIDLSLMTKQAHWNIRGVNFIAIHKMLDDCYDIIIKHQDIVAERIVQLNGIALGTLQTVYNQTSLKSYPINIDNIQNHLNELIRRYNNITTNNIKEINNIQDLVTNDILISLSRDLDKCIWLIESNIEKQL